MIQILILILCICLIYLIYIIMVMWMFRGKSHVCPGQWQFNWWWRCKCKSQSSGKKTCEVLVLLVLGCHEVWCDFCVVFFSVHSVCCLVILLSGNDLNHVFILKSTLSLFNYYSFRRVYLVLMTKTTQFLFSLA